MASLGKLCALNIMSNQAKFTNGLKIGEQTNLLPD